jgi:hypothetical protein
LLDHDLNDCGRPDWRATRLSKSFLPCDYGSHRYQSQCYALCSSRADGMHREPASLREGGMPMFAKAFCSRWRVDFGLGAAR